MAEVELNVFAKLEQDPINEEGEDEETANLLSRNASRSNRVFFGVSYSYGKYSSLQGIILVVFSVYSLRLLVPWLWQGPGLSFFLPVASVVYREPEHWQSFTKKCAILAHVVFGSCMLCIGTCQLDKHIRRAHPVVHRWCGRMYVICGILSLGGLQTLRASIGAGSSPKGHSSLLLFFVDVTTALWCGCTGVGVVAAWNKSFQVHRDAMTASLILASVPLVQRAISWCCLAPMAMVLRCVVCVVRVMYSEPSQFEEDRSSTSFPWLVRWGPPTTRHTLLFGSCDSTPSTADPRACPLVLSFDGYGEGEHLSFPVSAILALTAVLGMLAPRFIAHVLGTLDTPEYIAEGQSLSDMTQADVWRSLRNLLISKYALVQLSWARCETALSEKIWGYSGSPILKSIVRMIAVISALLSAGCAGVIVLCANFVLLAVVTLAISGFCVCAFLFVSYFVYAALQQYIYYTQ